MSRTKLKTTTSHMLDLVLAGRDKAANAYSKALMEVIQNRFECPECGDTSEKERNGPESEADGYLCTKCGWQDYTDLGPLEVELRGYKFRLQD